MWFFGGVGIQDGRNLTVGPSLAEMNLLLPARRRRWTLSGTSFDLTGFFVPPGEREHLTKEEAGDVDPEVQGGTDCKGVAVDRSADGKWEDRSAGVPRSWHPHPDLLPLAEGIRRTQAGSGETAERAGEGKHAVEAAGGGVVADQPSRFLFLASPVSSSHVIDPDPPGPGCALGLG